MAQMDKNLPAMQETWVWSLGQEDPLEEGMTTHSSILFFFFSLQYSCLENSIDGGAWWATVHGVAKSQHDWTTNTHTYTHTHIFFTLQCSQEEVTSTVSLRTLNCFFCLKHSFSWYAPTPPQHSWSPHPALCFLLALITSIIYIIFLCITLLYPQQPENVMAGAGIFACLVHWGVPGAYLERRTDSWSSPTNLLHNEHLYPHLS